MAGPGLGSSAVAYGGGTGGSGGGSGYSLDSKTIRTLSSNITKEVGEFVQLMNKAMEMAEGSKVNFESDAARGFRLKMKEFGDSSKRGVTEVLGMLSEMFEDTALVYETVDADIASAANTYLNTDIFNGGGGTSG